MAGQSKRLTFWKGLSVGEIVFLLVATLFVLVALWWVIKVDHRFWRTNGGSALFTVGFIAGACVIIFFRITARRVVLVSACPLCGAVARRVFFEQDTEFPEACGSCPAYLRIKGDDLAEQSTEDHGCDYVVPPARYLPAGKHDGQDRFEFRMPPICASCGSSEATQRRAIGNWNKASSDFGALGYIVSIVADVADVPSYSAHDYGALGSRLQDRDYHEPKTKDERYDRALEDIQVPVCAAHVKAGTDPLRYDSGKLVFRSYRYYKEFLRLNKIDGAAETKGSRAARR